MGTPFQKTTVLFSKQVESTPPRLALGCAHGPSGGPYMIAILFGAWIASMVQGTVTHQDCKAREFEPRACRSALVLEVAGDIGRGI